MSQYCYHKSSGVLYNYGNGGQWVYSEYQISNNDGKYLECYVGGNVQYKAYVHLKLKEICRYYT